MMKPDALHGFEVDLTEWADLPLRALLFGEAQGRVVISTSDAERVLAIASEHGVPARAIGRVTAASDGIEILVGDVTARLALAPLARAFHETIPGIMDGGLPVTSAAVASSSSSNS